MPDINCPTVTTAGSAGAISRLTMLCSAQTTLRGSESRIGAGIRHRAVAALAMDLNHKVVGCCGTGALRRWTLPPPHHPGDMLAEDHRDTIEDSLHDQHPRTGNILFRGLEDHPDGACQLILLADQRLGRAISIAAWVS